MAFPPPPYSNITGIAKGIINYVDNCPLIKYDGNAKPGELVVDLTTYQLYIGNAQGSLNLVGGGSGNGMVAAPVNSVQFNKDGSNFGGTSNFTWNDTSNTLSVNGLFTMQGDILPSSNNAYALGSNTLQWSELHVAGNTIYLGGVPLSMGTGSNLQVAGNDVAVVSTSGTTNFANLEISGDIYVSNVYSNGNVTSNYFIGDGSQLTNLPGGGNYGNSNVAAYLPTYNGALAANSMVVGNTSTMGSFFLQVSDTSVSFGSIAAQGISVSATNGITLAGTGGVNLQGVATSNINIGGGTGGSTNFSGPVQLGPISNVHISGGTAGQFLTTNGAGGLGFTTFAPGYDFQSSALTAPNSSQINWGGNNINFVPFAGGATQLFTPDYSMALSFDSFGDLSIPGPAFFSGDGSRLLANVGNAFNILGPNGVSITANYGPTWSFGTSGDMTAPGNVTADYFIGDGSLLTNLPSGSTYSNANVAAYLATFTGNVAADEMSANVANLAVVNSNTINATTVAADTVTANYFSGDGSNLSNISYSSIVGAYSNANVANYLPTYSGALGGPGVPSSISNIYLAGNIIATPYLMSIVWGGGAYHMDMSQYGRLELYSNLNVYGNIIADSGNFIKGDGGYLSNIQYSSVAGAYTNANVAAYLPSYTGVLNASNANLGNAVTANYFIGDGSKLTNINISNAVGAYGNSNVAAYLPTYTGNLTANNITATRTIQAATVNAYHTGTFAAPGSNGFVLYNGAGNVTGSAGLSFNAASNTLSVSNAISVSNATVTTATVTTLTATTANVTTVNANTVTANHFSAGTNSIAISQNTIQTANNTMYIDPLADGSFNGNVVILGGLSVTGNVTYNNIDTTVTSNLVWQAANAATSAAQATGGGLAVGPSGNSYATWLFDAAGNQWRSNLPVQFTGGANVDGAITGATTVTADAFIGDGGNLSNIQYSNVVGAYSNTNVANYLSNAPVTIAAVAFVGDGSNLSNIQYSSIVGAYGDSNVAAYLANSTSDISADVVTANAFVGDGGNLSNIQYSSIVGAYGDSNVASFLVGYSGVSSAGFFIGDGSNISNISYSNITGAYGDSNVEAYLATSTGNIQGDVITANAFSGDGSLLSNIAYSSLVGAYSNSNVADYLPGYAGDILADVSTANYFSGDGSNISNINVANIVGLTTIANSVVGNADLAYNIPDIVVVNYADSNWAYGFFSDGSTQFYDQIKFFGDGTADRGFRIVDNAISQTTFQVDGTNGGSATVAGWMTAAYLVGDGSMISNINYSNVAGAYSDSNVAAYLANSTGNIGGDVVTANAFIGNGAGLSNIQYSNIVGAYGNANVADYLPVNTANISGNVITGNLMNLNGDLSVSGNVYVVGNVNYNEVTNLDVGDPIIYIGSNNVSDIVDLGIVGQYNNGNGNLHTGFARDHSDGIWKLFTNLVTEPTTVIDWANATPAVLSAGAFVGDGSQLSNITYANINGAYTNSNVAAYLPTYTGNLVSLGGDVTTSGNVQAASVVNTLVIPRVDSISTLGNITIDPTTTDQYNITALAESVVLSATPGIDGQKLNIRIKDDGTPQTLSWDTVFQPIGVTLPTTTTSSKLLYVGCIYNTSDSTWDVVSVAEQA